jgi:hypothetical protein
MAERMVTHFGVDIMRVIDDEPARPLAAECRIESGRA